MLASIQTILQNDTAVAAYLRTWRFDDASGGTRPAVFTTDAAPDDCEPPLAIVTADGGMPGGVRGRRGGAWQGSVRVYGPKSLTNKALYQCARNIWRALDRATVTPDGFTQTKVQCSLPAGLPRAQGFPGYLLNLSADLQEGSR